MRTILGVDIYILCLLIVAHLTGQLIMSYKGMADRYGWRIGLLFDTEDANWLKFAGALLYWGPLIQSFIYNPWWTAPLCWLLGTSIGTIVSMRLKYRTQLLSLLMIPVSIIFMILANHLYAE